MSVWMGLYSLKPLLKQNYKIKLFGYIYIYKFVSAIDGQRAGPNWLTFFREHMKPTVTVTKAKFFKIQN